jgi:outer membrane murein-binding lipoprotein Lpp
MEGTMNAVTIGLGVALALAGAGCASSARIERGAQEHLAKAEWLEAQGDYQRAADERAAAEKQFEKARLRAADEARYRYYY